MLILTRKPGESLYIGDDIKISIVEIKGHQIRIGIEAPKECRVYREEIYLAILEENKSAALAMDVNVLDNFTPKSVKPGKLHVASMKPAEVKGEDATATSKAPEIVVRRKRPRKDNE